jgi:hypothetical protein
VDVRYDAGRFGSGYKDRPNCDASIRPVPTAEPVVTAMARRLDGCGRDELVFCGPGGSNGVPRGVRSRLSVGHYRRVYRLAVARAELPDLDPHGPHDLRHTFATWLEDGAVPARVIDELMGHQAGRRGEREGSMIGTRYRHMTEAMQARVVAWITLLEAYPLKEETTQGIGGRSANGAKPRGRRKGTGTRVTDEELAARQETEAKAAKGGTRTRSAKPKAQAQPQPAGARPRPSAPRWSGSLLTPRPPRRS